VTYENAMPICKICGDEVDELVTVDVGGKRKKLCETCAEDAQHSDEMAKESEAAVQQMMGFKGRR
jgi:ribosome-binding protein aMBF1 (putative translation factor)